MQHASIARNITYLTVLQGANFLFPLLTLPFLTRQLGVEGYGQVVFVLSIMQFAVIIVDYGYSWGGARDVAVCRDDRGRLSRLVMSIWSVQCLLLSLLLLSAGLLAWHLDLALPLVLLYAVGLGTVLGHVLFPIWLFQGLERLDVAATLQLIGKVLSLPILLWSEPGYAGQINALVFFSASALIPGCLGVLWIMRRRVVAPVPPTCTDLYGALTAGVWLYGSRISIYAYTTAVPIALGYWGGVSQLAIFNVADKARLAVQTMVTPLSQVLMPRMSYLFANGGVGAHALLRKSAVVMLVIGLIGGVSLFFLAEEIMATLGGEQFRQGETVLRVLSAVPVVVILSNLLGLQILLPMGLNRAFASCVSVGSLVAFAAIYPMVAHFGAIGAALVVLGAEVVVSTAMCLSILGLLFGSKPGALVQWSRSHTGGGRGREGDDCR
jgi:O-antigen/teichoic acid export membrane protein